MAQGNDWGAYASWHELFDALCIVRGHADNLALAERLCGAQGNASRNGFETAVKNLRNWRAGVHLPQRRNFIVLGQILAVDTDPALQRRWADLYRARSATETGAGAAPDVAPSRRMPRLLATGSAALLGAAVLGIALWPRIAPDPVGSYEGIAADYVRNVSTRVGEATIIHGARGNDCGPAPAWEVARELLPDLVTGTLSDGGVGTRHSRQCGGRVPARAILYTATQAGTEQFSLYGDDIVIRVSD